MRRAGALFAVAICLCSCETASHMHESKHRSDASWADAPCPPFTARTYLRLTQLFLENPPGGNPDANPYRARVEAAIHTCLMHHTEGSWETSKHCEFVVRAFRFAVHQEWSACLRNLLHDEDAPRSPGRYGDKLKIQHEGGVVALVVNAAWLNTSCSNGLMAGEMLDTIERLARMPPPVGPDPAAKRDDHPDPDAYGVGELLSGVILQLVNRCRDDPPELEHLPLPEHCHRLETAFADAVHGMPNDWQACADELDHQIDTKH